MTLAQMSKVLHEHFSLGDDPEDQHCTYLDFSKNPKIGFMIIDGKFARVDIDDPGISPRMEFR